MPVPGLWVVKIIILLLFRCSFNAEYHTSLQNNDCGIIDFF